MADDPQHWSPERLENEYYRRQQWTREDRFLVLAGLPVVVAVALALITAIVRAVVSLL